MKVPLTSTQAHQSSNVKPHDAAWNTTFIGSANSYEPKSVLDLRRSSSPVVADKPAAKPEVSVDDGSVQWDDHLATNFEDWETLVRELGLHDDSVLKPLHPFSHTDSQFVAFPECQAFSLFDSNHTRADFGLPDVNSNQFLYHNLNPLDLCGDFHHMNQWNCNFLDELIRAADYFDSNELPLAHVILARLNDQLQSPVGKPLQRAAFYFKEALQSLLTGSTHPTHPASSSEIVQAIKAYKNFSNVSPIVMFSNFTANQAILEAMDGSMFIHVVDFDIGFGGQWASFMKEVADRAESRKSNTPFLRITAVVSDDYAIESRLIEENLNQFARELKMGFEIDFISVRTFEYLSFKAIKFIDGEKTAVLLSRTIFHRMGPEFLTDIRQISPQVLVVIDGECMTEEGAPSFRRTVIGGLEFYSTVLESLEAASAGGAEDWIRRIEMFLLRPKIVAALKAAGRGAPSWRQAFAAAGLRPVGLSQFADYQADCLLRKVHVRGFHVEKRQAEMVLCWQERALVATSAWRC
ncbi:hypothetical protein NMG60_11008011 [Bertholletia excelsa]